MQLTLPALADMTSFQSAMDAGLSLSGTVTNGNGTLTQVSESPFFNMNIDGTFSPGGGDFTASRDGIGYDFNGGRIDLNIGGGPTPEPIAIGIDTFGLDFAMPIGKAEGTQPFKMQFNLTDLTMSENAWALFDPTAELPRDPATLIIDVTGEAELTEDLFNQGVLDGRVTPGTLNAVTLNQLRLDAAGVELTGEGGFTFDNSDMSMGFPKPLGAVDLALEGGNALMDKLVAMGLLPEDQAMGARMMMGLFAVPDGDDRLTTKIEFREDGGLYANGQRLQ